MDRLTEQNNGFEIGETEKKCGKWCREVLKSRTTRRRLLSLCPATNLKLQFFYVYDFTDIDECKGNHSCHVNTTCMKTHGSHVWQCHAGYTGNGANCIGKFLYVEQSCMTRSTTVLRRSAALQDNQTIYHEETRSFCPHVFTSSSVQVAIL